MMDFGLLFPGEHRAGRRTRLIVFAELRIDARQLIRALVVARFNLMCTLQIGNGFLVVAGIRPADSEFVTSVKIGGIALQDIVQ